MDAAVLDIHTLTIGDLLNGGDNKTLLLTGISWAEYEQLLRDNWETTNLSFAYDAGVLEIMAKSSDHEDYSRTIYNFVLAYCEQFEWELEGRGSMTFKRTEFEKGVEPDECFYIQSAGDVIGLGEPDSEKYPVPDVAVEIDLTTKSLNKFPIYAALKVSEVWIYKGKKVQFYQLAGNKYNQSEMSRAFPLLSAEILTRFIKQKETEGQTAALKSFRQWLRQAAE